MPSITLKGIPSSLHQKLKQRARENKRSLNQETLFCLEAVVSNPHFDNSGVYSSFTDSHTAPKVTAETIGRYGNTEALRAAFPQGYRIVGPMIRGKGKATLRDSKVKQAIQTMDDEEMSADGCSR